MRFPLSLAAILLSSSAGFAADISALSTITAATIYPGGATLTRTAPFSAEPGTHSIIVEDLPLNFDPASLRVTSTSAEAFTILSVNHRVDRLPPSENEKSPEYLAAEADIEAIEARLRTVDADIAGERARIAVAAKRLEFVNALITREPQKMVDNLEYQKAGVEDWAAAIETLAIATEKALQEKLTAEEAIGTSLRLREEIEEERVEAEQTLNALDLPPPPRSIATVEISTPAELDASLQIAYRTDQAGWQPVYDMRLDRGEKPILEVNRHAQVAQWTGEDWQGVELTLSTAQPSNSIAAPEMWEQIARIFEPGQDKRIRRSTSGLSLSDSVMESRAEADFAPEPVLAEAPVPGFTQLSQGETVVYRLNEPVDISGDQTKRQVRIDSQSFDVSLTARATPRFDTTAYLTADLQNSFGGPILPGQASIFRDGTFMGTAYIPFTAAGDTAELPFGALDEVLITHRTLEKEDGDFGLIGTTNRRVERFQITARSLLPYTLPLVITDQAPVSEQEDLEIVIQSRPRHKPVDEQGKRGVVSWNIDLGADADSTIEFGYDITWPGDQSLTVH